MQRDHPRNYTDEELARNHKEQVEAAAPLDDPFCQQETAIGENRGTHEKKRRNLGRRLSSYDLLFFVVAVVMPIVSLAVALIWMTNERW